MKGEEREMKADTWRKRRRIVGTTLSDHSDPATPECGLFTYLPGA